MTDTVWTNPQDGCKLTKDELILAASEDVFSIDEDMRIMLHDVPATFEKWLDFACHMWKNGCDIKTAWHALYELDERIAVTILRAEWKFLFG